MTTRQLALFCFWWDEVIKSSHPKIGDVNPSRKPTSPEQTQENEVYPEATVLYCQNDAWEPQPLTRFMGKVSSHVRLIRLSRHDCLSVLVASKCCRCKRVQHRQAIWPESVRNKNWSEMVISPFPPCPALEENPLKNGTWFPQSIMKKRTGRKSVNSPWVQFAKSNNQMAGIVSGRPVMFH